MLNVIFFKATVGLQLTLKVQQVPLYSAETSQLIQQTNDVLTTHPPLVSVGV